MRSEEREVTHGGMGPDICFQSARMRVVRRSRRQISGEIRPDMRPLVRPARARMGSSDSPRREISTTRPVVGSQLTPYHREQQSAPVHDENIPRYGSDSADRNARSASRSEAGHPAAHAALVAATRTRTATEERGSGAILILCGGMRFAFCSLSSLGLYALPDGVIKLYLIMNFVFFKRNYHFYLYLVKLNNLCLLWDLSIAVKAGIRAKLGVMGG